MDLLEYPVKTAAATLDLALAFNVVRTSPVDYLALVVCVHGDIAHVVLTHTLSRLKLPLASRLIFRPFFFLSLLPPAYDIERWRSRWGIFERRERDSPGGRCDLRSRALRGMSPKHHAKDARHTKKKIPPTTKPCWPLHKYAAKPQPPRTCLNCKRKFNSNSGRGGGGGKPAAFTNSLPSRPCHLCRKPHHWARDALIYSWGVHEEEALHW